MGTTDDKTQQGLATLAASISDQVEIWQGVVATLREDGGPGCRAYAKTALAAAEPGSTVALMARNEKAARALADVLRDLRRELIWLGSLEECE